MIENITISAERINKSKKKSLTYLSLLLDTKSSIDEWEDFSSANGKRKKKYFRYNLGKAIQIFFKVPTVLISYKYLKASCNLSLKEISPLEIL